MKSRKTDERNDNEIDCQTEKRSSQRTSCGFMIQDVRFHSLF